MCVRQINVRNHGTCLVRRGNKKPYESVSDGTAFFIGRKGLNQVSE